MSIRVCDVSMVTPVTVSGEGGEGGGSKFLPLYTSTLLLARVSQKLSDTPLVSVH
jgi:hypothetical protein